MERESKGKQEMKFNIVNTLNSALSITLFGGLTACVYYKDQPEIVLLASSIAFCSLLLQKGFESTNRSKGSSLNYAESVELSYLRQIRFLLESGKQVSDDHISVSKKASEASDKAYAELHGFGRPLPAVAASSASKLD